MDWRQARVLVVLCQWHTEVSSSASQSIRLLRLSVISALAVVTQTVTVFHLECAFLQHRCARAADSASTRLCRSTQSWARLIACRRRRHPCPLCSHKFCPTGWPSSASTRRVGSKRNLLSPFFSLFIIYFIFPLHSSRCPFFASASFIICKIVTQITYFSHAINMPGYLLLVGSSTRPQTNFFSGFIGFWIFN